MDKLTTDMKNSIFNEGTMELLTDYGEIGIDAVLDISDEVMREIPILRTIKGVVSVGQKLHERNLMIQTITFIKTLGGGETDGENFIKHKKKLENDHKFAEKELSRVLLLLNSYIDTEKSILLAKFYHAYINERISYYLFCEFTEMLSRLNLSDLDVLRYVKKRYDIFRGNSIYDADAKQYINDKLIGVIYERLVAIGIFQRNTYNNEEGVNTYNNEMYPSEYGAFFIEIAFDRTLLP
jgi:hypothetical protein